jgi:hypothetical protein
MARSCRGGGFWPAKPKNEPYRLDFGLGCVNPSADHRLSLCGGVYAIVCMLAHRVGEIERGVGFCLQNMKPSLANLVLTR